MSMRRNKRARPATGPPGGKPLVQRPVPSTSSFGTVTLPRDWSCTIVVDPHGGNTGSLPLRLAALRLL